MHGMMTSQPRFPQPVKWRASAPLFLGVLVPAVAFLALGSEVLEGEPLPLENAMMLWLHTHSTPLLQHLSEIMNVVGQKYLAFPFLAALPLALWLRGKRHSALVTLLALGAATTIQWGLKLVYGRPRPELWATDVQVSGLSFPSGHATVAAALAVVIGLLAWRTKWRWWAAFAGGVYAGFMDLSRVILGVHFPTDVLAGTLVGLFSVMGVSLLLRPKQGGD